MRRLSDRAASCAARRQTQTLACKGGSMHDCPRDPGKRQFLKLLGTGIIGAAAGSLASCTPKTETKKETKNLGITLRANPINGEKVSLLGYGCMRFPTRLSADDKKVIDEAAAAELIDTAYAGGINYFDTAYVYHDGKSEAFVGKALSKYPRNTYFLATKMPGRLLPTLDEAKKIFQEQLDNCRTEYFDYYLMHNIKELGEYKKVYEENGVLAYLLEEKKKGRIKSLGWSFHGSRELFDYMLSLPYKWDFVQIQLNYRDWNLGREHLPGVPDHAPVPSKYLYEALASRNIPVIIMEPLLGGALAKANRAARTILSKANPLATPASWAFRFAAGLPNVLTVLSGMTYMEHLQENLRTFSPLEPLNTEESKTLEEALHAYTGQATIPCTGCAYCMPCPFGVDIPAIFTHHNKAVAEEEIPEGAMDANYRKMRMNYLKDYDHAIPEFRRAENCVGCGKCEPLCPQKIAIRKELAEIAATNEKLRR